MIPLSALAVLGNSDRLESGDYEALYREVFPALDVLVMTSASEAFGIVLVEALMQAKARHAS